MSYPTYSSDTITITSPNVSADIGTYTMNTSTSITSGAYIYSTGAGNIAWGNTTGAYTIANTNPNLQGNTLSVHGDAEFDGDVKIKGKSINDSLERIEERLAILRPNEDLEEKWENLRALRNAYKELEAEIIEKEAMWAILKK